MRHLEAVAIDSGLIVNENLLFSFSNLFYPTCQQSLRFACSAGCKPLRRQFHQMSVPRLVLSELAMCQGNVLSIEPKEAGVSPAKRHRQRERTLDRIQTPEAIGEIDMPLTRDFKETVQARVQSDPQFRLALYQEALGSFFEGDLAAGKAMLRDYVNATIGFQELAKLTNKTPKSLMRMLSPKGNPHAGNLFAIISALGEHDGYGIEIVRQKQAVS